MKNTNKGRRKELAFLKYKKRVRRWANNCHTYITKEGKTIYQPKAIDIIKDNGLLFYKTTSTICSCWMCSYPIYDRNEFKKETKRLIDECKFLLNGYQK